jgi:hypothetical protein
MHRAIRKSLQQMQFIQASKAAITHTPAPEQTKSVPSQNAAEADSPRRPLLPKINTQTAHTKLHGLPLLTLKPNANDPQYYAATKGRYPL